MQVVAPPSSNMEPNYNIAPTQQIWVCAERDGERHLKQLRWGLVPYLVKELPTKTFNARAETISQKPTWKGSLNKKRCVIPATSFYEWTGPREDRRPYSIQRKDGKPLLFAGLWAYNNKIDGEIRSATIILCPPNDNMAKVHDRMPVILEPEQLDDWFDGHWSQQKQDMLRPCADDVLTAWPVGKIRGNHPGLAEPIGDRLF